MYPQLACKISLYADRIILSQAGREVSFNSHAQTGDALPKLFALMDGSKSLDELRQSLCLGSALDTIIQNLDEQGLLKDASAMRHPTPSVKKLSEFARELLSKNQQGNSPLWSLLAVEPSALPIPETIPKTIAEQTTEQHINILYGFTIEHYHLFAHRHTSHWPTPQSAASLCQLVSELYRQESTQADQLLTALAAFGISDADIKDTLPLPATMALCHGLSFWANFDDCFYITILGALTERLYQDFERYLAASEDFKLGPHFIEPLRQLLTPELARAQANLLDDDFQEIAPLDLETSQRFIGQIHLLADMLNGFHTAIGNYYAVAPHLLRRVSVI